MQATPRAAVAAATPAPANLDPARTVPDASRRKGRRRCCSRCCRRGCGAARNGHRTPSGTAGRLRAVPARRRRAAPPGAAAAHSPAAAAAEATAAAAAAARAAAHFRMLRQVSPCWSCTPLSALRMETACLRAIWQRSKFVECSPMLSGFHSQLPARERDL